MQEGIELGWELHSYRYVPIEGAQAYVCAPSFLAGPAKRVGDLKQDAIKVAGPVEELTVSEACL